MSIIENSGLINDISRAIDAFKGRIVWLFQIGIILVVVAAIFARLFKLLPDANSRSSYFIRCLPFWGALIGVACIIFSLILRSGNNLFGLDNQIQQPIFTPAQTSATELTATELEALINENSYLSVRVYGDSVYVAERQCKDINYLTDVLCKIDLNDTEIYLINDYAEDAVFEKVLSTFQKLGITHYLIQNGTGE